jgi:hypothetical protein
VEHRKGQFDRTRRDYQAALCLLLTETSGYCRRAPRSELRLDILFIEEVVDQFSDPFNKKFDLIVRDVERWRDYDVVAFDAID